jgi:diguanylate cyclase
MMALMLDILFVAVAAAIGTAGGWWIRGFGMPVAAEQPEQSQDDGVAEPEAPDAGHVEEIISRLHQLTACVAADVGEHSHRVQEITEELRSTSSTSGVISVVEKLIDANGNMERQLLVAEERLKNQSQEIESHVREARTDALTNLFNRRGFDDELDIAVRDARSQSRPLCVMMMDVDHFKKFNDTYGHQAGDQVLKVVGRVLRQQLADKEVVCRYGGEEFSVIFPGSDIEIAKLGAERARIAIGEEIVNFEGKDLRVTMSGGLAQQFGSFQIWSALLA